MIIIGSYGGIKLKSARHPTLGTHLRRGASPPVLITSVCKSPERLYFGRAHSILRFLSLRIPGFRGLSCEVLLVLHLCDRDHECPGALNLPPLRAHCMKAWPNISTGALDQMLQLTGPKFSRRCILCPSRLLSPRKR